VTAAIDCFDQNRQPVIDKATGGHFAADHGCWLGSFAQITLLAPETGRTRPRIQDVRGLRRNAQFLMMAER